LLTRYGFPTAASLRRICRKLGTPFCRQWGWNNVLLFEKFLLEEARRNPSQTRTEQQALASFLLAEAQVQSGRLVAAAPNYKSYLAKTTEGKYISHAKYRLAELLFFAGKKSEAKRLLEDYLQQFPRSKFLPYVQSYLAKIAANTSPSPNNRVAEQTELAQVKERLAQFEARLEDYARRSQAPIGSAQGTGVQQASYQSRPSNVTQTRLAIPSSNPDTHPPVAQGQKATPVPLPQQRDYWEQMLVKCRQSLKAGKPREVLGFVNNHVSSEIPSAYRFEFDMLHATAWERIRQFDAAISGFEKLADLDVDDEKKAFALTQAARLCAANGNEQEALKYYKKIVTEYPNYPRIAEVRLAWATVLAADKLQRKFAKKVLLDLLAIENGKERSDTLCAQAQLLLATFDIEDENFDLAAERLKTAQTTTSSSDIQAKALALQSEIAIQQNDWKRVLKVNEQLAGLCHSRHDILTARFWVAESLLRTNELEKALEEFCELQQLSNGYDESWHGIFYLREAQILAKQEQWDNVLAKIERLPKVAPLYTKKRGLAGRLDRSYEVELLRGVAQLAKKDYDAARLTFQTVGADRRIANTEAADFAKWHCAEAYYQQGELINAGAYFDQIAQTSKSKYWQGAAIWRRAACLEKANHTQLAQQLLAQLENDYQETPFGQVGTAASPARLPGRYENIQSIARRPERP